MANSDALCSAEPKKLTESLAISQKMGEDPKDWKRENSGSKKDQSGLVDSPDFYSEILKKIITQSIYKHLGDNTIISNRRYGSVKNNHVKPTRYFG